MPPPPQVMQQPGGAPPSVLQKLGMGAAMGIGVGLSIGFIGGAFQILRAGPGPKGSLATLSQFMGTSAATFGFFMSIGTVIRTEPAAHISAADQNRWQIAGSHRRAIEVEDSSSPILARLRASAARASGPVSRAVAERA